MSHFRIDVRAKVGSDWDEPHPVAIHADDIPLTKLLRESADKLDDCLDAPPIQLAFWVVDNWWRLRWEPVAAGEPHPEWRLAHDMSSIGGGYPWPRIWIWGEDSRVGISARSDPPQLRGPIRYLTDALVFVPADDVERELDHFLDQAAQAKSADRSALQCILAALRAERDDPDVVEWRRLEARLGYDVDEAPDALMKALERLTARYGKDGVEEAALGAQGARAAETLEQEISAAQGSRLTCNLQEAVTAAGALERGPNVAPWQVAERAAERLRAMLGNPYNPLRNKKLGEVLRASKNAFRTRDSQFVNLAYGLRLRDKDNEKTVLALRAKWSHDRRFELSRALGDAIWSDNDNLGPLTTAKSARQKFQRAFAQSLLCPYEGLRAFMNTETPTEEDISAAARHYHVAERVVQSVLVNKGAIGRRRFAEMVEAG